MGVYAHSIDVLKELASEIPREISHQRAVDAFMWAFNGRDSAIRQAGADGLARRGGPRGVGFLLEGLNSGERDLHRTVTMALALHANEAGVLAQGQVAADSLPKHVIDALGWK